MARKRFLVWLLFLTCFLHVQSRNRQGDSLLCYDTIFWLQTVGCLGGTSVDINSTATGRMHSAGEVFPTPCAKQSEEIWILKNTSVKGAWTIRLRNDTNNCLALDDGTDWARLDPCDPEEPSQIFKLVPFNNTKGSHNPDYKYFYIQGLTSNYRLIYDVKHGSISKKLPSIIDRTYLPHYWNKSSLRYYCDKWVWASQIERKANVLQGTNFTFPMEIAQKPKYILVLIDQMMASTSPYSPVTVNQGTCNKCQPGKPCSCFPFDYHLSKRTYSTVTLDLSMKAGGVGYEYRPSRNRIPTGMYAKPWKRMKIIVDDFDMDKVTIRASLFLNAFIVDDEYWGRPPQVTMQKILQPGMNYIRSPFGGPLTLEVIGNDSETGAINVTIYGVPMAKFKLGETTEKSWGLELQKEPSWVTFQGQYVVGIDIKAPYMNATFGQVQAMVIRYDLMFKNNYLLSGYDFDVDAGNVHAVPDGWHWWTRDVTDRGFMYAGNPVTVNMFSDKEITLTFGSWQLWGFAHEFAHNLQTPCFSHELGLEVTNNIYSTFHIAYFCGDGKHSVACKTNQQTGYDFVETWRHGTKPALATNKTYEDLKPLQALVFWLQLLATSGYEPFRNMHRRFRTRFIDLKDDLCRGGKLEKFDAVYETMSEMTGYDLAKHFDVYRIRISTNARKRVRAQKYPKPTIDISKVEIPVGTPLSWRISKKAPRYALEPFRKFLDAQ